MAFLGYWGYTNEEAWVPMDALVVVPALCGFLFLAYVPWVTTAPTKSDETPNITKGRKAFAAGAAFILVAVSASLFV